MSKYVLAAASLSLLSLSVLAGGENPNEKSAGSDASQSSVGMGTSEKSFYFRAGPSLLSYKHPAGASNPVAVFDWQALDVGVGKFFSKHLAAEARLGVGVSDDDSIGQNAKLDFSLGAYLRGEAALTPRFSVYGLLGVAYTDVGASAAFLTNKESEFSPSYAVGALFNLNKKSSVGLEYLLLHNTNDHVIEGVNMSYRMKF